MLQCIEHCAGGVETALANPNTTSAVLTGLAIVVLPGQLVTAHCMIVWHTQSVLTDSLKTCKLTRSVIAKCRATEVSIQANFWQIEKRRGKPFPVVILSLSAACKIVCGL